MSVQIFDKSTMKPFYSEKPSFYNSVFTENANDQYSLLRSNSSSKANLKLKKEIGDLTREFRKEIIPSCLTVNRPLCSVPRDNTFSIHLLTKPKVPLFSENTFKNRDLFSKYSKLNEAGASDFFSTNKNNKSVLSIGECQSLVDQLIKSRKKS